jgi:hypothetical protein
MAGRLADVTGMPALPLVGRLAPPPPADLVAAHIESGSAPGEIVADPWGRGGWVARAAVDRQRRALTLETSPLTRLVADVVLRPPDLRHLDAAVSTLGTAPRGETSLRLLVSERWQSRCATCGRSVILEDVLWLPANDGPPVPTTRRYRCPVCRDLRGGAVLREAPLEPADLERAGPHPAAADHRAQLRDRFPGPDGAENLPDDLLGLHTDRQLVGLAEILAGIEGELRAANVLAALRLAFVHAVARASRLTAPTGRLAGLRVSGGRLRPVNPDGWRECNPWIAFEESHALVREFVQDLEGSALGPLEARLGQDMRDLVDGSATAIATLATPEALARVGYSGAGAEEPAAARRASIRLLIGQPPPRPSTDRLAQAVHATAWALGRGAADLLPAAALAGPPIRAPWSWQSATIRRSLEAFRAGVGRGARAVILVGDGGAEAVAAAALGGAAAGWRVVDVRLPDVAGDGWGHVELVPPSGILPPGPRSRSNAPLDVLPGGAGDPSVVAASRRFVSTEAIDARPFSSTDAARVITETAVDVLTSRGEPVEHDRLLAEILVGLDRSGQLHRLAELDPGRPAAGVFDLETEPERGPNDRPGPTADDGAGADGAAGAIVAGRSADPAPAPATIRSHAGQPRSPVAPMAATGRAVPANDPVERLLSLVRDELERANGGRLMRVGEGRWWLGDATDRASAAVPLSDRLEWAVYSILSTAGRLTRPALRDRLLARFAGHDRPDESLLRACIDSYGHPVDGGARLATDDDLRSRTAEQARLLAQLANGGHRLGMHVWIGRREQGRLVGSRRLADYLEEREQSVYLPGIIRAPVDMLDEIDCIWYVRGRLTFIFELDWTAMLGDLLLRRHARIPADQSVVRFLAVPAERTDLVRYKLAASPVLDAAFREGGWQVITWANLRAWLATDPLDLPSMEAYLGLEPMRARGEQLGLFPEPSDAPHGGPTTAAGEDDAPA